MENGREFVKNVEEEIGKALREMERLVREGCEGGGQEVKGEESEESDRGVKPCWNDENDGRLQH